MLFDRVKEFADFKKLTLREVEDKAGLADKSLYKWKSQSPKAENLKMVADVLGVSTDYLLGNTDNPYIKSVDEPDELTASITEVVTDAINNAQAYNGKEPTKEDKELMTDLLTAWLKSGGK